MNIKEISNLNDKELQIYSSTSEIQLLRYYEPDSVGIFIAESPKVIRRALDSGYIPLSVLAERKYINGQASDIIERCGDIPIYTADSSVLTAIAGFKLTQGILCAMRRKPLPDAFSICRNASRIAVLEDVMNQTNVGAVFRSAAALGFEAVLLTSGCSNPLYRRSVRVSMGTVFQIPWTYIESSDSDYISSIKDMNFKIVAMALTDNSISIRNPALKAEKKLAVILGTEGEGLKKSTVSACDYTVKIPMYNDVDSLNVAAASAVAFWELGKSNQI